MQSFIRDVVGLHLGVALTLGLLTLQPSDGSMFKRDFVTNGKIAAGQFIQRIPLFGKLQSILRVIRPQAHFGRKSDYRSDFDENFVKYHASQLWKIDLNRPADSNNNTKDSQLITNFISLYGTEIWNINEDHIDVLIQYKNTAKAKDFLGKINFTYNVMIEDIESAIDETYMEVNNSNSSMPWLERDATIMNWNRYHDLGAIQQFMQHILDTYPEMAEVIQIGLTHNKRTLEVLRISNGNPQNWAVVIAGGFQARDWISPAAITYVISKLMWQWEKSHSYMRNIDWYFLPVVNPDGYQYSRLTDRLWTKNRRFNQKSSCYGVNLDRNFDYNWGKAGSSPNPCKNVYRGPIEFSEPETRAIKTFLVSLRADLAAYISVGAYGQAITYPWGDADFVTDNQVTLHKVAKRARSNIRKLQHNSDYKVGSSYRLKLARSGNSADWIQESMSPHFVYNVFLKDKARYGYLLPPKYIVESGEEAHEIVRTIVAALKMIE